MQDQILQRVRPQFLTSLQEQYRRQKLKYNYVTKNSSWTRKHPKFEHSNQKLQNQTHHCSEAHSSQRLQIIQSLHQMDSLLLPVQLHDVHPYLGRMPQNWIAKQMQVKQGSSVQRGNLEAPHLCRRGQFMPEQSIAAKRLMHNKLKQKFSPGRAIFIMTVARILHTGIALD